MKVAVLIISDFNSQTKLFEFSGGLSDYLCFQGEIHFYSCFHQVSGHQIIERATPFKGKIDSAMSRYPTSGMEDVNDQ